MIKIGLVIPSLQTGGMERAMSELARFFSKKRGVEVHLILYGKSRDIFYSLPENIKIYTPPFNFTDYSRIRSTLKTLIFLRKTIKKISPKAILSFGEYWNNFVLLALFGIKIPVIVSDRCQPDKSLGLVQDFLRNHLYPSAAGIVAQTSTAKKIYQKQCLNDNIRVIGNPIYQISKNGEPLGKENIILSVGRLIETKNHDRLIKIFSKISPPGWKLVIIGGDALKQSGIERLKKLIKDLGVEERVELTGTVSNIDPYYLRSKIFAFTSSSEGFPNVIAEAMSAGLPVVAYDCVAGPSDLIDDGETGFLIPLFEDTKFAQKLKLLIEKSDLRLKMGGKGMEKISAYDTQKIAEEFYSFISSVQLNGYKQN